jgi:hypothetical protein
VVVDLREANVLIRKETQVLHGGFDARRAGRNALKEFAELVLVDSGASEAVSGKKYSAEGGHCWRDTWRESYTVAVRDMDDVSRRKS